MRLLALLFLVAAGCSSPSDSTPPRASLPDTTEAGGPVSDEPFASEADYRQQRATTRSLLDEAIGEARASDVAACRAVPVTEQACGGPTEWAVYSEEDGETASIERLAARLVALDVKANAQFERMSTCVAYSPPQPLIRQGRCANPRDTP